MDFFHLIMNSVETDADINSLEVSSLKYRGYFLRQVVFRFTQNSYLMLCSLAKTEKADLAKIGYMSFRPLIK